MTAKRGERCVRYVKNVVPDVERNVRLRSDVVEQGLRVSQHFS
jgi:hypothetical protein